MSSHKSDISVTSTFYRTAAYIMGSLEGLRTGQNACIAVIFIYFTTRYELIGYDNQSAFESPELFLIMKYSNITCQISTMILYIQII